MDTLLQDVRYALRTLVSNPGFAALTIMCLALGIGVNSTIFSVVDTVAIRPLPFSNPDALVALHTTHKANGVDSGRTSYLDLQDWKARTHAFADLASVAGRSLTIADQVGNGANEAGRHVRAGSARHSGGRRASCRRTPRGSGPGASPTREADRPID
jgi:hypothetical protein